MQRTPRPYSSYRVARLPAEQAAASLHGNRPGRRRARRKTAVRRIDDERGAPRRRVVFAPVRNRGARAPHGARQNVHPLEVLLVADADVLHACRVLLVGQELPRTVLRGPLERHAVLALGGPLAMQVGVAPRRTRAPCRLGPGLRVDRACQPHRVRRHRHGEHGSGDRSSRLRCHRPILWPGVPAGGGVPEFCLEFAQARMPDRIPAG